MKNKKAIMSAIFKEISNCIKANVEATKKITKEDGIYVSKDYAKGYSRAMKEVSSILSGMKTCYNKYPETIGEVGEVSFKTKG
jgi:hypothetical protein